MNNIENLTESKNNTNIVEKPEIICDGKPKVAHIYRFNTLKIGGWLIHREKVMNSLRTLLQRSNATLRA